MRRVMPLGDDLITWGDRAKLMGVLNVTPDRSATEAALRRSRSARDSDARDDGDLDRAPHRVDLARVVDAARRLVDAGAEFIDVGQSTRPGATLVSAEEGTARTPAVAAWTRAFAGEPADRRPRVSVDTFYGSVAAAAVAAGATSSTTSARERWTRGCSRRWRRRRDPCRTSPCTCAAIPGRCNPRDTTYAGGDVAGVAGEELAAHVAAATRAGVEPWRLWTDPGLGFAKTHEGCWICWKICRECARAWRAEAPAALRAPMRVGASEGFPGAATGREGGGQRRGDGGGVRGGDVGRRGRPARARRGGGEDAVKAAGAVDAARRRRRRTGTADAHPWEERGA